MENKFNLFKDTLSKHINLPEDIYYTIHNYLIDMDYEYTRYPDDKIINYYEKTLIWSDNNGKLHSKYDLPCIISTKDIIIHDFNGIREKIYNQYNFEINYNDSISEFLYKSDNLYTLEWWHNNKCYRPNGKPCIITPESIEWHNIDGLLHSSNDNPSRIIFDSYGNIIFKEWHKNGELHRINGPAVISQSFIENWINGKYISYNCV